MERLPISHLPQLGLRRFHSPGRPKAMRGSSAVIIGIPHGFSRGSSPEVYHIYANNFCATFPDTSVKRKSRPWKRKVSFV